MMENDAKKNSTENLPSAILFCCNHNAVRSPMAEGIMKKLFGTECYVQSAGVKNDLEIDGFAIQVCSELDVELSRHRSRSFDEMEKFGDDLSSFDLVIALSEASFKRAEELTKLFHIDLEYWPMPDPTDAGENREARLESYRNTRDEITQALQARWGE